MKQTAAHAKAHNRQAGSQLLGLNSRANLSIASRSKLLLPQSSTRCQAFVCSSQVTLLSVRVRPGCVGLWYAVPTFGGGEGWVARPLVVLVDVLRVREQFFCLKELC